MRKIFRSSLTCSSLEVDHADPARAGQADALKESFITIPASTGGHAALQYYQPLESLSSLVTYLQETMGESADASCHEKASKVRHASYIDINYDATSRLLVCSVFWPRAPTGLWNGEMGKLPRTEKWEVGLLADQKANSPEELSLGGWLSVIGEDSRPSTKQADLVPLWALADCHRARSDPLLLSIETPLTGRRSVLVLGVFPFSDRTASNATHHLPTHASTTLGRFV